MQKYALTNYLAAVIMRLLAVESSKTFFVAVVEIGENATLQ